MVLLESKITLKTGDGAPDFSLKGIDDEMHSLGSYTGNKKGYKGLIDEVSIWSTAMSSLSVNRVYNDRVSNNLMTHPRHNSLLVWHRFGDDIKDSEDGLNDQLGNSHGAPLNIRSNDFVEDSP